MTTTKWIIYGAIGFVAYRLLVHTGTPAGAAPAVRAPAPPPPPQKSQAEQIADVAISYAAQYGVQQCIDAGYDSTLCRGVGAVGTVGGDDLAGLVF